MATTNAPNVAEAEVENAPRKKVENSDPLRLRNTAEAAARIGISKRTLQEQAAARKIGFVKIGRNVRFSLEDIDRFIESHRSLPVGWKAPGKGIKTEAAAIVGASK